MTTTTHRAASPAGQPTMLRHNKVDLALWDLTEGQGRTGRRLLVLHGLGEATRADGFGLVDAWPGPVAGLDLTGHGASSIPVGSGYFCEVLMGDVDVALGALGAVGADDGDGDDPTPVTVAGRGLGGYIALLIAGARPDLVAGAVILDGPGLRGGGEAPSTLVLQRPEPTGTTPDPMALVELGLDIRPADYARTFAWQAAALSPLDEPIAVAAINRPPWLAEVVDQPGVVVADLADALRRYAGASAA